MLYHVSYLATSDLPKEIDVPEAALRAMGADPLHYAATEFVRLHGNLQSFQPHRVLVRGEHVERTYLVMLHFSVEPTPDLRGS